MGARRKWIWLMVSVGLVLTLALATGCKRSIVAETPVGEGTGAPVADVVATAYAEATRTAAEATAAAVEAPVVEEAPTTAPTAEPPTSVPPTEEPTAAVIVTVEATAAVVATVAPTVAPTDTPAPQPTVAPTAVPASGGTVHVVQAGENLFRIALRYGTTVAALQQANGLSGTSIYVGQRLTIPGTASGGSGSGEVPSGGTTYVVQAGENLFRIALKFNMTAAALAEYNGISDPSSIYAGQVLRIPPR